MCYPYHTMVTIRDSQSLVLREIEPSNTLSVSLPQSQPYRRKTMQEKKKKRNGSVRVGEWKAL